MDKILSDKQLKFIGILLTHYRGHTTLNQTLKDTLDAIAKKINTKLFDNLIRDTLWAELPESYDEVSISIYRQKIYEYLYTRYNIA